MTATKDATLQMQIEVQSTVRPLPRLLEIESLEGNTELTRVGPAWRRSISEPDTEENEPGMPFEDDASAALRDFRASHERRRQLLTPVMFVMGCSIGILAAIAPHSRFFRRHFQAPVVAAPVVAASVVEPAAAPPRAPESTLAMGPIIFDAPMPAAKDSVVVAPALISSPLPAHAHAGHAAHHATSSTSIAKSSVPHTKSSATSEDEEVVKNAHAADDLAAAQLTDAL